MSDNKFIDYKLEKKDTLILKGIAILGMLCWHIFYCSNPEGVVFSAITRTIGIWGNVCVSAFLFASGYGLSVQFVKINNSEWGGASVKFVIRRMLRFYSGYWMVLLLFLPIGLFVFNTPICDDCGIKDAIVTWGKEILGIRGHSSYNPSWWFNALIISLYLLFPLLFYGVKNACLPSLIIAYLLRHLSIHYIGMDMGKYLFIFVIGMVLAVHATQISTYLNNLPRWLIICISVLMLLIPMIILPIIDDGAIFYTGLTWYAILTIGIYMLIIILFRKSKIISKILEYLGKHSANIYLIQSLLYYMWFPKLFYSIDNPYLIVFVLTIVCLGISILLEAIKYYSGYNRLFDYIIKKI